MAPGGGYDAELSALRRGAGRLLTDGGTLTSLGGQAVAAAHQAAGGIPAGPLVGALARLAERLSARTGDLAQAVQDSSRAVSNCATTYEQDDAGAQSRLMASVSDAGGSSSFSQLMGTMLAPQPTPDPNAPPVLIPGLTNPVTTDP